jgi:hypothetical protein
MHAERGERGLGDMAEAARRPSAHSQAWEMYDLEGEEVGEEAAALLEAQEGRPHGGPQQQPLQVRNGLVRKVQQAQRLLKGCTSLDIRPPACSTQQDT